MNSQHCLRIGYVFPFIVIGFILGGGCKRDTPDARTTVVVSGNLPLTGPIAAFSGKYPNGFMMGLDEACSALGIPRDRFSADFQDNAGQTTTSVSVMQRQLLDGADVYVSGTSAMSDAIISEVSKKQIPHFLVSFDAFMTKGDSNAIRILPNFKIEAPLFVKFAKLKKAKTVFCFTPNLKAYLEESDKLILPGLREAGIRYERELFEFDQKEYRSLVEKADRFKPDVIIVSGYAFHVYPILRSLREYGLVKKSVVICTLDYIDLLHGGQPRDILAGISFVTPVCEIPGKVSGYSEWRERFEGRFNVEPSYVDAYAYDTARIIVECFQKHGSVDSAGIVKTTPYNGVVGRIVLDGEGDLSSTLTIGHLNEDGVIEQIE